MFQGTKDAAGTVFTDIKGLSVEQGPGFLRLVAFLTAMASFVLITLVMLNPGELINLPGYILKVYIAAFALTTMLFEAKQEWISSLGPLSNYQDLLIRHCEFLTLMGGRGLFYVFQGTLWLSFADSLAEIFEIGIALSLIGVGVLHLAAHYGVMPKEVVQKVAAKTQGLLGRDVYADAKVGSEPEFVA